MIPIPENIRGLVFDCDGTIADTMPLHYEAWVGVLQDHAADFPETMFYEMAGIPTRQIIEILNERHGYKIPVESATRRKEELFLERLPKVKAIEPVVRVVHENHGRLPMAVATGGTRAICTKTLAALGLLEHFAAIVTADDVLNGKPSPDIFLEAASRIVVAPADCLAFEDGDLGIQSARAAGMAVIDIRTLPPPK